jgi:hypothetical protein
MSSLDFPDDALTQDMLQDLERVDSVMTQILRDPAVTEEFIYDPSGVLTRLGLHPRTTRGIHDRVNRIFYAVLTNTQLMEVIRTHLASFSGLEADAKDAGADALGRGEIPRLLGLDLAATEHFLGHQDVLRRMFQLTLHDLNNRRLLENVHTTDEVDGYIEEVIQAIYERRAVRDFPTLESWDNNYGTGRGQGDAVFLEVGPAVTAVALVEVLAAATVAVPVAAVVDGDVIVARINDAPSGDPVAATTLATAGAILRLAGDMLVHANNFERR